MDIYILAVILQIGYHEVIVRPYYVVIGQSDCLSLKFQLQPYTTLPLTCMQMEREV